MFVIVDLEWITDENGHYIPTQLAASRVNEDWDSTGLFSAFIKPKNTDECVWSHPSYTGGNCEDFIRARSAYNVLTAFNTWLENDDILLWWHEDSLKVFNTLNAIILGVNKRHRSIILNHMVYTCLKGQASSKGNPYKIAAARNVSVNATMQHNSLNDVQVLRKLLKAISLPQSAVLNPEECKKIQLENNMKMPYQYHEETNTIHIKDCELVTSGAISTQGCETIRGSYNACTCCKDDYKKALIEHNKKFIEEHCCNYIYSTDSDVYHTTTCSIGITVKNMSGTKKHRKVLKSGRRPCKFCNPTAEDEKRNQKQVVRKKEKKYNSLSKEDKKALTRQRTAIEERQNKLANAELTEDEKADIYTLTQPRFAFWVGRGYQNFHRHNCQRLKSLTNLTGFSTYNEAVSAGFTPCKHCKPTSKNDMKFSIPITSHERDDEKIEDIIPLCENTGFVCYQDNKNFYIDTPVGKWKITINSAPIKLEHINLIKSRAFEDFHIQPRKFLSYTDVVEYIKRHDTNLIRSSVAV